jgi:gliding motility-associated-like protein
MKKLFYITILGNLLYTGAKAQVLNNNGNLFIDEAAVVQIGGMLEGRGNAEIINNGMLYITGDVTNNGATGLFDNTSDGRVILDGKGQRINGSAGITFPNLELLTNTKTSSVPVFINHTLNLGNAVLLAHKDLSINSDDPAAIQRGGGYVATQGNGQLIRNSARNGERYIFPMGTMEYGAYQPVDITTQVAEASRFGIALHGYNASNDGMDVMLTTDSIERVNDRYYYTINHLEGTHSAALGFYSDSLSEKENSGICTWDEQNNVWATPYKAVENPGAYGDKLNRLFVITDPSFIEKAYTPVLTTEPVITKKIQIPNSFTANEDGLNEFWEIKGIEKFPDNKVTIFNRWGEVIYETRGYSSTNYFTGSGIMQGVYMYVVEVRDQKGYHKTINGDLTIIR